MRGIFGAGEAELFEQILRLILIVARIESRLDISKCRGKAGEIRLLRQIANSRARLHEAAAAVGFHQSRDDFQKRRFSGAVAADQTDALAG